MQGMSVTLLDSYHVTHNADSVEFQPTSSGNKSLLISCSYQLEEKLNQRIGNLTLFDVSACKLNFVDAFMDATCGYLDCKWLDNSKVATACSNGEVKFFRIKEKPGEQESRCLVQESCIEVDAEKTPILLSLVCITDETCSRPSIICSSDKGYVHNVDITSGTVTEIGRHSCEVWTCSFNKSFPNMVISGGDDCLMNLFDLRMPRKVKSVDHPAGVCCVQTDTRHQSLIVSGCYDDHIRLFDYRYIETESSKCSLFMKHEVFGGPWRLKFNPGDKNLVGIAAMYEGYKTLQLEECEVSKSFSNPDEKELLAYGFDWSREHTEMFATCSFYDRIVSLWKI